jgi:hypothetical protein
MRSEALEIKATQKSSSNKFKHTRKDFECGTNLKYFNHPERARNICEIYKIVKLDGDENK